METSEAIKAALDREIHKLRGEVERQRQALVIAEARVRALEEFRGRLNGTNVEGAPSRTEGPRRESRSEGVARRKAAMVAVLRASGPLGPGDLLDRVRDYLKEDAITRAQVTDLLRRFGAVFEQEGRGMWRLAPDLDGAGLHANDKEEIAMG